MPVAAMASAGGRVSWVWAPNIDSVTDSAAFDSKYKMMMTMKCFFDCSCLGRRKWDRETSSNLKVSLVRTMVMVTELLVTSS